MRRWLGRMVCVMAMVSAAARGEDVDPEELVARANAAFAEGEYAEALEKYRAAEVSLPESAELAYNQAVAQYKLGEYAAAESLLNAALSTRDLDLEAKVKFNLGNVAYASALEKLSSPSEAIDLLKRAIGRYRDALDLDPEDEDAKANIHTAQLLIKDMLDKLKKQQEQQQDKQNQQQQQEPQQDEQQQEEERQQDGGDQHKEQEQQDPQQHQQGQQGEQQRDEPQGTPQARQEQEQDGQEQGQAKPVERRRLSKEEAERLLQAVRDKERQRREERARRLRARHVPVERDW